MKQTRAKKWQVSSILGGLNRCGANLAVRYEGKPQKVVIGDGTSGAVLVKSVARGTALVWLNGYETAMMRHSALSDHALEDAIYDLLTRCGNQAFIPSVRLVRLAKGWDLLTAQNFVNKIKARVTPLAPLVVPVPPPTPHDSKTDFLIDCAMCGKHSVQAETAPSKCDVCSSSQVVVEQV